MKLMMDARGIRNNNPGNIRYGSQWKGLSEIQRDRDFCTFESPEWGIRAMGKILLNYQNRHRLNTVSQIINRWAPPVENNTSAYITHVANLIGFDPDDPIVVREHLKTLCLAIIKHENGMQPYNTSIVDTGVKMALGEF